MLYLRYWESQEMYVSVILPVKMNIYHISGKVRKATDTSKGCKRAKKKGQAHSQMHNRTEGCNATCSTPPKVWAFMHSCTRILTLRI